MWWLKASFLLFPPNFRCVLELSATPKLQHGPASLPNLWLWRRCNWQTRPVAQVALRPTMEVQRPGWLGSLHQADRGDDWNGLSDWDSMNTMNQWTHVKSENPEWLKAYQRFTDVGEVTILKGHKCQAPFSQVRLIFMPHITRPEDWSLPLLQILAVASSPVGSCGKSPNPAWYQQVERQPWSQS